MSRLTSLCLASSLLAIAGCDEQQARFADATPEQLSRAYSAAAGNDLMSALFLGSVFSGRNDPAGCPPVATQGQDTLVSGDCTDEDGVRFDGSMKIHNLPGLEEENRAHDLTKSGSVDLDFEVTKPEHEDIAVDGHVERDVADIAGDLKIAAEGITSISRLTIECATDGACTASSDSEIEISDLGVASVEGTWSLSGPPSGSVTVRGADTIVFDINKRDRVGCVPFTIGEKTDIVCLPEFDRVLTPTDPRSLLKAVK